jgi:hypothetical protein
MSKNVKTTVEVNTVSTVIGPGGVRMTYSEWLEMRKSEMD